MKQTDLNKTERDENIPISSTYDEMNEPIVMSKALMDTLLKEENPADLIAVYMFYYYTAKWQKTNQPKASSRYTKNGLSMGYDRLNRASQKLMELGLIEKKTKRNDAGQIAGWYIKVNFVWTKQEIEERQLVQKANPPKTRKKLDPDSEESTTASKTTSISQNNIENSDVQMSDFPYVDSDGEPNQMSDFPHVGFTTCGKQGTNALSSNKGNALSSNKGNALSSNNKKIYPSKIQNQTFPLEENGNTSHSITKDMFPLFWKLYPRKIAKGSAQKSWDKICAMKEPPTWREIKSAIRKQTNTQQWQTPIYIPHPTTWLNQQRWLDEVDGELTTAKQEKPKYLPQEHNSIGFSETSKQYKNPDIIL